MMRNYLILLLLLGYSSNAQEISLVLERKQNLIQSIANPITIFDKNCRNYVVTTDNGKIEQNNADCKFVIFPDSIGVAEIRIYNKSGKLIAKENYRVKAPEFFLNINGFEKIINDVNRFSKSARLELFSDDLECINFSWDASFELVIVEENKKTRIPAHSRNGSLDKLKEHFTSLKSGDILFFHTIKITIDNKEFKVSDIVLEIE
ncbi:hypothetical protein J2X31_001799 [Flavobacterium arsenatis]|uniref:Gliding motility-associated protein GldM C-terminal domain-containing protein n=1 Tax=Flavobacterium arsenatis TaxID=1484332 RepID=A0ABU1TP94_9FLAO|nr:GldM family protein [Flavobacterium arsenatis]MDR6967787.1 hypothetical protein [Flavobacterium arsenatis]